jgi:8-oxo-dGTP diphosphatase
MSREYPLYPIPSCHAAVRQGDRFLLVQRARPPFKGYWSLPGGSVEVGETVEEALTREIREETGLTATIQQFLGYAEAIERDESGLVKRHYIIFYFEAIPSDGKIVAGSDALAVCWMSAPDARTQSITDSVERCFQWLGV